MTPAMLCAFVLLVAVISLLAYLTDLHRGPFGAVLRLCRANAAEYQTVATILWAVVVGLVCLALGVYLFPAKARALSLWGILFFAAAPSLISAVRGVLKRNAP